MMNTKETTAEESYTLNFSRPGAQIIAQVCDEDPLILEASAYERLADVEYSITT